MTNFKKSLLIVITLIPLSVATALMLRNSSQETDRNVSFFFFEKTTQGVHITVNNFYLTFLEKLTIPLKLGDAIAVNDFYFYYDGEKEFHVYVHATFIIVNNKKISTQRIVSNNFAKLASYVSKKDFESLISNPNLRHLDLSDTRNSKFYLPYIAKLTQLESLSLNDGVEDEDLVYLQKLSNLRFLSLNSDIVGTGLKELKNLKSLQFLRLSSSNLDMTYCNLLQQFSDLVYFDFCDLTKLKEFSISNLGNLKKLRYIEVHSPILYDRVSFFGHSPWKYFYACNIPIEKTLLDQLNLVEHIHLKLTVVQRKIYRGNPIVLVEEKEIRNICQLKNIEKLVVHGYISSPNIFKKMNCLKSLAVASKLIPFFTQNKNLKTLSALSCDPSHLGQIQNFTKLEEFFFHCGSRHKVFDTKGIENIYSLKKFTCMGDVSNTFFKKIVSLPNLNNATFFSYGLLDYESLAYLKGSGISELSLNMGRKEVSEESLEVFKSMKNLSYLSLSVNEEIKRKLKVMLPNTFIK